MRDFTTNNYCDSLWASDLLEIKADVKNVFSYEIINNQKSTKVTLTNVTLFGTIVEVKQVGSKDFLYHIDDGTGIIACKHSERQFEEIISVIENEQMEILNQLSATQRSFEQSSVADYSADDSVFNDRSIQIEEVNFNKWSRCKGLLTIWDDIYNSFTSLLEQYNIGDSVVIQGKLYTYFNTNQLYINTIRTVGLMEEITLASIKLEDSTDPSKENSTRQTQVEKNSKRLSGLITFDNIPHLNAKISIPTNITTPVTPENSVLNNTPDIVTPNLEPTITFDTFAKSG